MAVGALGALALAACATGGLHTRAGRPLLARLGGCPAAKVAPADVERARDVAVRSTRGERAAPARPALGFRLDATTLPEVRAWAAGRGVDCVERRDGTLLQCPRVDARALPAPLATDVVYTDVSFGFRASDGTLSAVTALATRMTPAEASARTGALSRALSEAVSEPPRTRGDAAPDRLARRYATVALDYRFADYLVDVTATTMPDGVSVYERYTSGKTGT
jgi:hypothetical protein